MSSYTNLTVVDVADLTVISDDQINESWIDSQDYEAARLALSRALGLPEPELYDDSTEATKDDSEDLEACLNQLLDVQERMDNGMALIRVAQKERDEALEDMNNWYNRFNQWIKSDEYTYYPHKKEAWNIYLKGLTEKKMKYQGLKDKLGRYWNRWNELKGMAMDIVGDNSVVWFMYFQLKDGEISDLGGENEDLDNMIKLFDKNETVECYCDSHLEEMQQYNY